MTRTAKRLASLALLALTTAAPALAQSAGDTQNEIVVEAPRSASAPVERSPYTGAPIVTTTVRITALYGDLDLRRAADAARLRERIERVAQAACQQLDRMQPFQPDPGCVRTAVAKASPAVDAAIARAAE
jgi:UrcA family protein